MNEFELGGVKKPVAVIPVAETPTAEDFRIVPLALDVALPVGEPKTAPRASVPLLLANPSPTDEEGVKSERAFALLADPRFANLFVFWLSLEATDRTPPPLHALGGPPWAPLKRRAVGLVGPTRITSIVSSISSSE